MKVKRISFKNQHNPAAQFDLIRLEDLFSRTHLDHSPTDPHRVDFYAILFVTGGHDHHTVDFSDFDCEKGTVLTIRKDQIHKFSAAKKLSGWLLLFTDTFLVSYLEEHESQKSALLFNEMLGSPKLQLSSAEYRNLSGSVQRIEEEYFRVNDQFSMSLIRGELHMLITRLFRTKSQDRQTVTDNKYLPIFIELQRLVELHAAHTKKVGDYAKMMGLSTKTLNTVTRSVVHKSAKEFVDEIRTMQIKRLLINTKLSVKEVAYNSGFEESSNLYKYFRRQTQTTPEQFRELHKSS